MFGDTCWESDSPQEDQYYSWRYAIQDELKADDTKRLVIVEIGAGIRVPTVRFHCQSWVNSFGAGRNRCTLIRINV